MNGSNRLREGKKSTIENRQKAKTSNEKRHPWSIEGIHV